MADWTEFLPHGVENPIVIEITCPPGWDNPKARERLQAEGSGLDEREVLDSKSELVKKLGADHLTILADANRDHWNAKAKEPGRPAIPPDRRGGQVFFSVHLPPTAAKTPEDEERAVRTVMDWFESSKVGQAYLRAGRALGMTDHSAKGRRFARTRDIADLSADAETIEHD